MKFIINGFHEEIFFPLVLEILNNFDVTYGHLTYTESKLAPPSEMKAIFHDVKNLAKGDYDINWEKISPLDENIIEAMSDCEVQVLKMMDRHYTSVANPLTYDERKRLYLKHLRYWNHVLEKNTINLFLSSSPPHEVYDFVIYCLCKLKKIPTVFLFQTRISDTITIMEDWKSNDTNIAFRYKEMLEKYKTANESDILLSGRLKRDFDLNTGKKDPMRFEMLRAKTSPGIVSSFLSLISNLNLHRFLVLVMNPKLLVKSIIDYIGYLVRIRTEKRLARFYRGHANIPDISQKYIYFPLHLQPEATTSPLAGVYVDQILIAQMIAYYLPDDVYIYVKENPYQTAVGRDIEFYKELLKISQVRLVPDHFNTYSLTDNCLAVATATGTAGLEALYRCKPVLMFGNNFYQYANGVFKIKNNSDCKKALNEILINKFKPNIKDIKIFLKALEDTTIEGYIDVDYKKDTCVTDNISNKNILEKLTKRIKQACHL